jgi:PAS domain S-box-containing protein
MIIVTMLIITYYWGRVKAAGESKIENSLQLLESGLGSTVDDSLAALRYTMGMCAKVPYQWQDKTPAELLDLRQVFDAVGDGLVVHDVATGRVIAANPAAWTMHGCMRSDFVGQQMSAFVHESSWPSFAAYCQVVETSGEGQMQGEYVHMAGLAFDVDVHGTRLVVGDGLAILSVVRDVSARVAAERQLEQRVAALHEQTQALAVLAERQRLAQELHDAVNQSLFSAGLIAEVLPNLWARNPVEGQHALEDLRRLTRGALAEMRMLLAELRPAALSQADLHELLRLLANALAGRTNIPVSVTVTGEGTLPADVQIVFYRLCQEALTNIAKHAEASVATVELHFRKAVTQLRVRDNGRGFNPSQIPSGHYGLSMMRERAESVGAALAVTSKPGAGTEIVVRWQAKPPTKGSSR